MEIVNKFIYKPGTVFNKHSNKKKTINLKWCYMLCKAEISTGTRQLEERSVL